MSSVVSNPRLMAPERQEGRCACIQEALGALNMFHLGISRVLREQGTQHGPFPPQNIAVQRNQFYVELIQYKDIPDPIQGRDSPFNNILYLTYFEHIRINFLVL